MIAVGRGLPDDFLEFGRSNDRSTPKRAGRGRVPIGPASTQSGR